ncbi:lysophospholipid acyltransferase family protein [Bacillus sp. 2205SS5-2]|uniref:lysophospholipid acyltransferase family protein n=1 Tax=Bacillus sp. 2205SS5-2 TaxID=3109031 RepID=UPI003007B9E2
MNNLKKSKYFQKRLSLYITFQLKRKFHAIHIVDGRKKASARSKLYLVNHSSWWDGLIIFYLNHLLIKEDSYAMMSAQGLIDHPFFEKIGAFPVDPSSPKNMVKSLQFAEKLLDEQKSLWIFPQGKEEHVEKRPLTFMNGASYLISKKQSLVVIPVAMYYSFRHYERPELFIRIGEETLIKKANYQSRDDLTVELQTKVEGLLNHIRADLIEENIVDYENLLKGFQTLSDLPTTVKRFFHKGESS